VVHSSNGKKKRSDRALKDVEYKLEELYFQKFVGFFNDDHKRRIIEIERKKMYILDEKEIAWRLKRRALWLENGNENTKFFH